MQCIIERVSNEAGTGDSLINLDQSDSIDHKYLVAVLMATSFSIGIYSRSTAMYSNICSVVSVNDYL